MHLDLISLALKNVKKRGIRSWLTMLGIFIGIAAVVSLISLGNALQSSVTGQFSSIDPDKLTIQNAETGFGPPGSTAIKKLTDHDLSVIERVNGVDLVFGRLIRTAEVTYNDVSKFKYVGNIPPEQEAADEVYDTLNINLLSGSLLKSSDRGQVVLGNDFTNPEEFDKEIRLGRTIEIQDTNFKVSGFLEQASTFIVNSVILMPDEDMRSVLNIPKDEHDLIIVQIDDPDQVESIAFKIEEALREDRNLKEGEEDFSVETPKEALNTVSTILTMINLVIIGIAAISLLVGGIGITNTMYTSVLERTKEIGVLKSIGAKNSDILKIFLYESSFLGLLGGVLGAIIGLSLAFLVSYAVYLFFPALNFTISPSIPLITLAILFSLCIGTLAGILPALQASRLKPVEALRK